MRDERPERVLAEPGMEQAFIGAAFMCESPADRATAQRYVNDGSFTRTLYRQAWRLICDAWERGEQPDPVTVGTEIAPVVGVEPTVAVGKLIEPLSDPTCWGHTLVPRARMLRKLATRRELVNLGAETTRHAYSEEDVEGVLAYTARLAEMLDELDAREETGDVASIAARVEERAESGAAIGWPSGLDALDAWRGGVHPGEVYVVGGPTGAGKTWALVQIANQSVTDGRRVAFVTLEMTVEEVYVRMVAGLIGFKAFRLSGSGRTWDAREFEEYATARDELATGMLGLYQDNRSVEQIAALVRTTEPDVVLVDYVQLMQWPAGMATEYEALSRTMNDLQTLAKRARCVMVVATQMARAYQGKNLGPVMGGAGAGRIDQAADVWLRIDKGEESGQLMLRCAKNRHGIGGEMLCKLDAKSGRIVPV